MYQGPPVLHHFTKRPWVSHSYIHNYAHMIVITSILIFKTNFGPINSLFKMTFGPICIQDDLQSILLSILNGLGPNPYPHQIQQMALVSICVLVKHANQPQAHFMLIYQSLHILYYKSSEQNTHSQYKFIEAEIYHVGNIQKTMHS